MTEPRQASSGIRTFLFTDIEGSTRLWEREPDRMRGSLARHDASLRSAVEPQPASTASSVEWPTSPSCSAISW